MTVVQRVREGKYDLAFQGDKEVELLRAELFGFGVFSHCSITPAIRQMSSERITIFAPESS